MSRKIILPIALIFMVSMACNIPFPNSPQAQATSALPVELASSNVPTIPPAADIPKVLHIVTPPDKVPTSGGKLIYDVESSGTAPEKRAPYGDSYNLNRLERPFLQDMTYVPDLDIVTALVSQDDNWFYVSMQLIGTTPNNPLGIKYGVELDTNHDGFGDYIIWARPSYTTAWDTLNVDIFADKNHDSAGLSAEKSDAPVKTDGYETQIFHGGAGDTDPDMAWVRANAGPDSTIQFAFKKSWSGTVFMLGVMSDAGLKNVSMLDYVDRFTEKDAGSPVRNNQNYPLKALFAVDNTCQEAFGFKPTGYEPKLCPHDAPHPGPKSTPAPGVQEMPDVVCQTNPMPVCPVWPIYCPCNIPPAH